MTFEELGLGPEVLKAVADAGYTQPTPIQEQAIPYVLMGRDVLGSAQTGTGKTAGFTLPMIEILAAGRAKARMPRSLILEPTRELAAQVAENFETYGKYHKLSMALLIGGVSFDDQEKKLDRGVDVLIATPGRLLDHVERGKVLLNDVKILVIDEADRMLDMGFIPDVERIVALVSKMRQTLFFSATMPPEILRLAYAFLMNPKQISVAAPATAAATVRQAMVWVNESDKREALRRIARAEDVRNGFIFCNRKRDVDILFKSLKTHGFSVGAMHGDMSQPTRIETLEKFRTGEIKFLVCSDVAARGIDIEDVSHVFVYDVPMHPEDFIHRIGRTGRAGREGKAFMLASGDDVKFVDAIERMTGHKIPVIDIDGLAPLTAGGADDGGDRRRGRGRGGARGAGRGGPKSGAGGQRGRSRHEPRDTDQAPQALASVAPDAPAPIQAPLAAETTPIMAPVEAPSAPVPEAAPQPEFHASRHPDLVPAAEPKNGGQSNRGRGRDRQPRRDQQREEHRDNARNNGRDGARDGGRDQGVVGMGDHVPAFLLRR